MRKLTATTIICIAAMVNSSYAESPRLEASEFTIMPWGITPWDEQRDHPKVFDELRECGFNHAGFVAEKDLDRAQSAGLKALVYEPSSLFSDDTPADEITSRVKAMVARTKDHPAVQGYYLRDEPMPVSFPTLAVARKAISDLAPDALAYINLLPTYGNNPSYTDYVTSYIESVKPKFLSYDHYAMIDDGTLRDGYFQNLEYMRDASLESNLPFWNIVLGNRHFTYAKPSLENLRFQAYTTLAYGAKGISYFTYFAPHIGNYELAPIDQFGHKTPTWDMLRNVNLQIHALGQIYKGLKSLNVFHAPTPPPGCKDVGSSRVINEISGTVCVGEFEDADAQPYILVVNTDLNNAFPLAVKLKVPGTIQMISPYTGQLIPWTGEQNWLSPGQGVLLKLPRPKE
jgi:hypothetical protein